MPTCVMAAYSRLRRAHVAVAQICVRVDLQDRQPSELRRGGGHERRRDRMFPAERHEKLPARQDLAGDAPNLVHERPHFSEGQFHRRQREDADIVHVGADLFIPQFHVRRRFEDFAGTVARPRDVRRRPIHRYRQNDHARIVERFHRRHRPAILQGSAVLVLEGKTHLIAIIAEIAKSP